MEITNHKSQITNKFQILNSKLKIFGIYNIGAWKLFVVCCLLFVVSGLLVSPALAHSGPNDFWMPGEPIVPCGSSIDSASTPTHNETIPCTECDIFHLIRHIIDFILIGVAPILGVLFFIIAGVMIMLGGANPGLLARGKSMFKNTFIGILIVMLAWLITNTLVRSLVDPSVLIDPITGQQMNWYEFNCPFQ